MIHGGNSVAASWAPLLREVGGAFHAFAPDRPGCGLTYRQDYRGVPFREHAVKFIGDVMDGLGLERATLVGNSMGGYWALVFALANPERVNRIALLGEPTGSVATPGIRFRIGGTPVLNRFLFSTVLRPRRDSRLFAGLMADPERASRNLIECQFACAKLPGAAVAWRTMLELVVAPWKQVELTHALIPELPKIDIPVLFTWGDRDFAPVDAGRAVSRAFRHARFEVIPDAGHLVWLDQPEVVGRLLLDFMRSNPAHLTNGHTHSKEVRT
jgi:pimeloyl-ACP methyl ester carboxylesterase